MMYKCPERHVCFGCWQILPPPCATSALQFHLREEIFHHTTVSTKHITQLALQLFQATACHEWNNTKTSGISKIQMLILNRHPAKYRRNNRLLAPVSLHPGYSKNWPPRWRPAKILFHENNQQPAPNPRALRLPQMN